GHRRKSDCDEDQGKKRDRPSPVKQTLIRLSYQIFIDAGQMTWRLVRNRFFFRSLGRILKYVRGSEFFAPPGGNQKITLEQDGLVTRQIASYVIVNQVVLCGFGRGLQLRVSQQPDFDLFFLRRG